MSGARARLRDWIPEIVLVAVTTAAGIRAGGRWIDPTSDPGLWWSLSSRLAQGEVYYRDIPLQFGPLSPYLLALGVRVFGFSIPWVLLSNWIPAILAGILLLRLARDYLGLFERLAVVGLLIGLGLFAPGRGRLVYPYSPAAAHAMCFSLGALLLARRRGGGRSLLWPGVLAGLAFACKQEIGVAALAALLLFAALGEGAKARRAGTAAAGFASVAALAFGFALWSAPLESLRQESHLWPLASVPPTWAALYRLVTGTGVPGWAGSVARSLGALAFSAAVIALLGLLRARERRLRRLLAPVAVILAALVAGAADGSWLPARFDPVSLSMTACLALTVLALGDRALAGRGLLAAFGLFSALVASRAAFSPDVGGPYAGVAHFGAALSWPLLLLVALPRRFPGGEGADLASRRIWLVVLLPIGGMLSATGIGSLGDRNRVPVDALVGRFWVSPRQAGLFLAMSQNLRPGERVAVLPEDNAVDVIYGVRPASRYVILMPGTLDAVVEQRVLAQFRKQPPDAVVVFDRPTPEYRVAPLGKGFGVGLMQWIGANYLAVARGPAGVILRPAPGSPAAGRYNPAP